MSEWFRRLILKHTGKDVYEETSNDCFFCKVPLTPDNTFTLQYSSSEGTHIAYMCGECSKTFDEFADMKDEAFGQRFDPF